MPNLTRAAPLFSRSRPLPSQAASEVVYGGTSSDIQAAIYALTPGRVWQEKVKLVGQFTVNDTVIIPAYTYVDATESYCVAQNALNKDMFRNEHSEDVTPTANDPFITWESGRLDGNRTSQTTDATDPITGDPVCNLFLGRVPYVRVLNITTHSSAGENFKLTGRHSGSEKTEIHTVDGVYSSDSYRRGITIQNAVRNSGFRNLNSLNDCVGHNTNDGGVWIGHSEANYSDTMIEGSGAAGLWINNVRKIGMSGVQVKNSWFNGLHVIGFVSSQMLGIVADSSSLAAAYTYSDLFLSNDRSLSYGATAFSTFQGQFGDDSAESSPQSKFAIEWQDTGADVGTTGNPGATGTANRHVAIKGNVYKGGASGGYYLLPAQARMGTITMDIVRATNQSRGVEPRSVAIREGVQPYRTTRTTSDSSAVRVSDAFVNRNATGGARSAMLPLVADAQEGWEVTIRKSAGGNNVTVLPQSGEQIDRVVDGMHVITIVDGFWHGVCNGVGWDTIKEVLS